MKYIKVKWPEIQDYMLLENYDSDKVGYDPIHDCWFVPEDWEPCDSGLGGSIGDLDDALG